ncbi:MAG: phosphoglycerate kinase [Actinobacteria bacterium]|nr:phosphoglycerate kinase [Actinomycetota bacterium]
MRLPTLEDLPDPSGLRVLLRADFNVPQRDDGTIADDLRIRAALPTIEWLSQRGAHVTACTHLGRPKGKPDPRYSVEPVRRRLKELAPQVELLENLRFDPGEEGNDAAFVDRLVDGQDLYVNDAFGAAHRAHASIVGPPTRLPSAAGRLLAGEVDVLGGLLEEPKHPFVAVLGGAKVSDKLGVIDALLDKVDQLVVGGAMCFTFFVALGHQIGDSLVEPDRVDQCKALLDAAGDKLLLPSDISALGPNDDVRQVRRSIPPGYRGLDIGPGSAAEFSDAINDGRTVFWNGPMGVFEDERFAAGTRTVAYAVAECRGFTIVGGGDVVSAVNSFGLAADIDHVSTGGGASLEFIEQGDLPGLAALRMASNAN